MRKLAVVLLAVGSLCLMAIPAFAEKGDMAFGVNGGVVVPTGDFGDFAKMGFTGGVFGEYGIHDQFALGIGANYVMVSPKDDYTEFWEAEYSDVAGEDISADFTMSIIPITLYAKWLPPMEGNLVPYVQVGGGYYLMKFKEEYTPDPLDWNYEESESKPGFFGGAGVDFKVNPQFKVGAFAQMHDILTEDESTMYFTAGVSVGFGLASK